MKLRLKQGLLVITGETPDECRELAEWAGDYAERAFRLEIQDEQTLKLTDLGPQADACREPINVISTSREPEVRLISNFADLRLSPSTAERMPVWKAFGRGSNSRTKRNGVRRPHCPGPRRGEPAMRWGNAKPLFTKKRRVRAPGLPSTGD